MDIIDQHRQFEEDKISFPDEKNFFVIVGSNNSGKSTLLRSINKTFSTISYLVSVNRTILKGEGSQNKDYRDVYQNYKQQLLGANDDNYEKGILVLQDFFNLRDIQRAPILNWYNTYFPNEIYEEREDPENSASPMFLKVNGHSITSQGSGMRSVLEIFVKLFDPTINILCIDEPEMGLEPTLQKFLFKALKDAATPEKKIFLCTHSHHFLDQEDLSNNYICKRNSEGKIRIDLCDDIKDTIFRLLGNTLASFMLPEKIVVLEGVCDDMFLKKCLKLLDKKNYAVHNSGGDGNITYAVNAIEQFIKFNHSVESVFINNLYVIADKQFKDVIVRGWQKMLPDAPRQLIVLQENGIEYFYPERVLQEIFSSNEPKKKIIDTFLQSNPHTFNGKSYSKVELAKIVSEGIILDDLNEPNNEFFAFLKKFP